MEKLFTNRKSIHKTKTLKIIRRKTVDYTVRKTIYIHKNFDN